MKVNFSEDCELVLDSYSAGTFKMSFGNKGYHTGNYHFPVFVNMTLADGVVYFTCDFQDENGVHTNRYETQMKLMEAPTPTHA